MKKLLRIFLSLLLITILALAVSSCAPEHEIIFATDLLDNTVVADAEYSFRISAVCDGEACNVEVNCNGILLNGTDGKYTVSLREGENTIEVIAQHGETSKTKTYRLIRKKGIVFETDLSDGKTVVDAQYSFGFSATEGGEECKTEVFCNDVPLTCKNGLYTAQLNFGKNTVRVVIHTGDGETVKTYSVIREAAITIDTDIDDGAVIASGEYKFRVRAFYGDEPCKAEVTFNGIVLSSSDGNYNVFLKDGTNEIEVVATYGDKYAVKTYRINAGAEFSFSTSLDNAKINNDSIEFSANVSLNGKSCAFYVSCNGIILRDSGGKYKADLVTGINKIVVIARDGDLTQKKEWNFDYKGFRFVTDLESLDTLDKSHLFRALACYGEDTCNLTVKLNGKILSPENGQYKAVLEEGDNNIVLVATSGNISKEYTYTIRYIDSNPTILVRITDGKTYKGSIYSFDVVAKDGLGKKLSASHISFSVDWDANDGVDNFIPTNEISTVWDDSTMTSFRIYFSKGAFLSHSNTPFVLKVTVTDNNGRTAYAKYTMTYTPVAKGEKTGDVIFSLEGFSIECGYFVKPVRIPVYEGVPFSKTLTGLISENGWKYTYTGTINSGFYLASIEGLDINGNRIVDGVWDFVKDKDYLRSIEPGSSLGEFDFGSGSGWMYSVNGVYKNYGFADYYPQDGDTVRVQFTVILGEDLGGGGALGGGATGSLLDNNPDYAPIMELLADIAQTEADKTVYNEVLSAISEWNISQSKMNEQIRKLKTNYGKQQ